MPLLLVVIKGSKPFQDAGIFKDVNVKYNDSGAIRKIKVTDEYLHSNQFGIIYRYNFK